MRHVAAVAGGSSDWRDGAACRHHDPELFFPEGTAGPAIRQADQAKRVCQSCPVRAPCLDFALRHGLAFGIWGGATGEERRDISARRPHDSLQIAGNRNTAVRYDKGSRR